MKQLVLFLICLSILFFAGCVNNSEIRTDYSDNIDPIEEVISYDLHDFRIVYSSKQNSLAESIKYFKYYIDLYCNTDIQIFTDKNISSEDSFEILVGNTDREESKAKASTMPDNVAGGFVSFTEKKIIINGNGSQGILSSLKMFINLFCKKSNDGKINIDKNTNTFSIQCEDNLTVLPYLTSVSVGTESEIDFNSARFGENPAYTAFIVLQHNNDNNGLMFLSYETHISTVPVYISSDGGVSWKLAGTATFTDASKYEYVGTPMLYELPEDMGDMPAGTLLMGCTVGSLNKDHTAMILWRSFDLGKNWEEYSVVDYEDDNHAGSGLYEPYLIYDYDEKVLACFYSDSTDKEIYTNNGQRIVMKVSSDGKNWGERILCVAPTNQKLRPGMPVVIKMGENGYMMIYEVLGGVNQICYKISDKITEWSPKKAGTLIKGKDGEMLYQTPWCCWTPSGGEKGTIVLTGMKGSISTPEKCKLFFSNDLGKTWYALNNPFEYDKQKDGKTLYSYSPCLFTDKDGSVYYVNNVFPDDVKLRYLRTSLKFTKLMFE